MHLCLFEDDQVGHLLPLVHTRGVYDLRLGIRTLLETTREAFGTPQTLLHARPFVAAVTAQENDLLVNRIPDGLDVLFVNGRYVAEEGPLLERLRRAAAKGEPARVFVQDDTLVAAWVPGAASRYVEGAAVTRATFEGLPEETVEGGRLIGRLWDLLDELEPALERDYTLRTKGYQIYERPGVRIMDGAILATGERIYTAPESTIRPGAILNAEDGPIYIDRGATISENAVLRGPIYVGPKAVINPNAAVHGSAIGYWSKVGGEIHNTVFHSLSNKAHEGHLGDAYVGRWCNFGADTNNSNLKNDYGVVSLYDAVEQDYVPSGRQLLGLVMGDHSKCGINTMFNTGTVVGVFCNIYGPDYQPRYIPSFSWGGGASGFSAYRLEKALSVAEAVMARRDAALTDADRDLLAHVFETTEADRTSFGQ